ncbi:MAG: GntR family transcriptional regulator [Candidatus Brocadiia bacterium]
MPGINSGVTAASLVEHLEALIASDRFGPGDRLPTFAELRERFGCATNTIDRAYSELETRGEIERIAGSGVYVSEPQVGLTNGLIGCLGGGFQEHLPYWMRCLKGIRGAAEARESQIVMLSNEGLYRLKDRIEGLLVSGEEKHLEPHREVLQELPTVAALYRIENCTSVVADDYAGARMATDHLLELGHRRIAAMFCGPENTMASMRLAGYRSSLAMAGITPDPEWNRILPIEVQGGFTENARLAVHQWIEDNWDEKGFTALLMQNDQGATGAVQAFREAGMRVPDDVSVVGFDGTEAAYHCHPRLTTVKVPLEHIGERAAQVLIDKIENGGNGDEVIIQPTELLVQESTAPPPKQM